MHSSDRSRAHPVGTDRAGDPTPGLPAMSDNGDYVRKPPAAGRTRDRESGRAGPATSRTGTAEKSIRKEIRQRAYRPGRRRVLIRRENILTFWISRNFGGKYGKECRIRPAGETSGSAIARRLRLVRLELYGEHGGPLLAEALRLPFRTWANFERGVTIPGEVLLEFVEITGCEPLWLLRGAGAAPDGHVLTPRPSRSRPPPRTGRPDLLSSINIRTNPIF